MGLQVDQLLPSPPGLCWESHVTLISYAAWRQRPRFVKSLLRAGADPSIRYCSSCSPDAEPKPDSEEVSARQEDVGSSGGSPHSSQVAEDGDARGRSKAECRCCHGSRSSTDHSPRSTLASVPPAYAVWIVTSLSRMRLAGVLATQGQQPKVLDCQICGLRLMQPVAWSCGHLCCEPCFWGHAGTLVSRDEELGCPHENCQGTPPPPLPLLPPPVASSLTHATCSND